MSDPYRAPGSVEIEPPARCDDRPYVCGTHTRRAWRPAFSKALSVSATIFLLVASASLSAVAYSVVRRSAEHAHRREASPTRAPVRFPAQHFGPDPIGSLGNDTHAVDELWRRAEQLAETGADVTLSRASMPRARVADWAGGSAVRVAHDAHAGGLRILDLGDRSPASLAGVRPGDVITAVNGFPLSAPDDGVRAFSAMRDAEGVVAEMWREGRRVVLRVDLRG